MSTGMSQNEEQKSLPPIRRSLSQMLSHLWAVYIYGYEYNETNLAKREPAEAGNEKEKLTGGR